jgi:hypothetical protein
LRKQQNRVEPFSSERIPGRSNPALELCPVKVQCHTRLPAGRCAEPIDLLEVAQTDFTVLA